MSPTVRSRYRLAPSTKIKDVRGFLKSYRPEPLRYLINVSGVEVEVDAEDLPDVQYMHPAERPYILIGLDKSMTLHTIETINEMNVLVNSWTQSYVPRRSLDVDLSSQIHHQSFSQERQTLTGNPREDISRLEGWIDHLKKRALEVISYSFPDGVSWWFAPQNTRSTEYRRDHNVFRYSIYRRFLDSRANHQSRDQRNMLLAYQAPSVLSKIDLESFVAMQAYPTWEIINRKDLFNSTTIRLWTKVWEVCRANDAHYFIITSYKNWVFGCFSPGYTAAYVSDVVSVTDQSPTALGYLSFWMASAAGFQGSYTSPPKIEEPVNTPPHNRESFLNYLLPPPELTEPLWMGDNTEPGLSAAAEDQDRGSDYGMHDIVMDDVETPPYDDEDPLDGEEYNSLDQGDCDMLRVWFQGTKSYRPLNEDDFPPTFQDDVLRERPEERYRKGVYRGDWLLAF